MSEKSNNKEKKEIPDSGRRGFLKFGLLAAGLTAVGTGLPDVLSDNEKKTSADEGPTVKMLTPDGKMVEVSKAMLDKLSKNKKASKKEIYDWMNNPSKDNKI
jgi:hypothetical protein